MPSFGAASDAVPPRISHAALENRARQSISIAPRLYRAALPLEGPNVNELQ